MLQKGLVQIYTGNGKGKTTASLGLAFRAAGREHKVLIFQFLKPPDLEPGERLALNSCHLPITIEALDGPWDMTKSPELIELADLVSEIKAVKHPYEKGISARAGIEY